MCFGVSGSRSLAAPYEEDGALCFVLPVCVLFIFRKAILFDELYVFIGIEYGMCIYGLIGFSFDAARNCEEDATKTKNFKTLWLWWIYE